MAIPLSDFYAFSAATGSPVPEDAESRARIAPQIAEWRRNQLKAPEQKSDFLSALGTGAAIAGLGAAALLGARALRRPQAVTQAAVRDVTPDVEQTVRRAATYRPEPQTPRPPRGTPAPSVEVTPPPSRVAQPPSRQPGGVSQVDLYKLLETERPQGVVVTDLASLVQPKPQVRSETKILPAATEKPDAMSFIGQYFQQKGTAAGSLTDFQRSLSNLMSDQAVNAIDAAEDQMTGRIKQQLQRNEDLDMSQVDLMEEVADYNYRQAMEQDEPDAPINQVASQLPDGPPVDQAEGMLQRVISSGIKEGIDLRTGQRFSLITEKPRVGLGPGQNIELESSSPSLVGSEMFNFLREEREKIAQDFSSRGIAPMPLYVEQELSKRLGKGASTYGPEYSARRQALELIAQTGDPKVAENVKLFGLSPVTFETFENMPAAKQELFEKSAPMSLAGYPSEELTAVVPSTGVEITLPGVGERVDISTLRKPVITESTATAAEEYVQRKREANQYWLDNIKKEVVPQLNEIYDQRRSIIQNQAMELKQKQANAQASGNTALSDQLEKQINVLRYQYRNPQSHPHRRDETNLLEARIRGAERSAAKTEANIERRYPTTLSDWSGEAGRVFGELDVNTGEFIPETMEVRAERRAADLPSKGGGGRNVAEYTAGERLDEEIRRIQGGGRIRDYDETGAPAQHWKGDETQTGRVIGIYGIRPSGEKGDLPSLRPSEPRYTAQEIAAEALRMAKASQEGDVPIPPEKAAVIQSLGSQPSTPASRASVELSEAVRKGKVTMPPVQGPRESYTDPDKYFSFNLWDIVKKQPPEKPVQLKLPPDIVPSTPAAARVRTTPADIAAQQLGKYMAKMYKPRSTPLTSAAVIQPTLF